MPMLFGQKLARSGVVKYLGLMLDEKLYSGGNI